jgi:Reverse transcriptase (RNA-dependent DNA polymerase)
LGSTLVLNVDLQDFFPSIHFGRVRGLFRAVPYELPDKVAQVLAQICCYEGSLPQGGPTSPIVSNMICSRLDSQLTRLAQRHRCAYTRYADDLTFSTSMPQFPSALAMMSEDKKSVEIGGELQSIVTSNGFRINLGKSRLQPRNRRQEVTGLTSNRRPNIQRKYVRQIRAMLHDWKVSDLEVAQEHYLSLHPTIGRRPGRPEISFARVVKGKIGFLGMVRGTADPLYLRFREELRLRAPELVPKKDDPLTVMAQQFADMAAADDPRRRGYILQDLIKRLFDYCSVPLDKPFIRNEGAEQIDGAFRLDGWHYIVECRWREKLANIRELDGLSGQVSRSGKQTMGFFLSINGWSDLVPDLLKQNPAKSIVLMNGSDLSWVLSGAVDLTKLILAKVAALNLDTEPYYAAEDFLRHEP